jgi:hypothetical protein
VIHLSFSTKSFDEIFIPPIFYFRRLSLTPIFDKDPMRFKSIDALGKKLRSQLQIEVKIVLPGIRGLFDSKTHRQEGYPDRCPGLSDQQHPCFLGCPPALFEITGRATGHHIRPFRLPTFRPWDDMVVSQLSMLKRGAAVLALSPIPNIKILSGKFNDGRFSPNTTI